MEFRTINDLNNIIKRNLYKISEKFDLIVAVPRSGFLPATMLSLYLNIPMTDLDNFLDGKIYSLGRTKVKDTWIKSIDEAKHILIVEDSSASGTSLNEVKERILISRGGAKCPVQRQMHLSCNFCNRTNQAVC